MTAPVMVTRKGGDGEPEVVRDPTGQALVNDAPAGHRPAGFDPSRVSPASPL